eukprot:8018631-Alexandrium_andersonii.AAC.1
MRRVAQLVGGRPPTAQVAALHCAAEDVCALDVLRQPSVHGEPRGGGQFGHRHPPPMRVSL